MSDAAWVISVADWNGRPDRALVIKVENGEAVLHTPPGNVARLGLAELDSLALVVQTIQQRGIVRRRAS